MEQNKMNTDKEGVSFWSLLRLFGKKIKTIVIIGVIAAIIGGSLGVYTYANGKSYRAELIISVSTEDDSDALIYSFSSGLFDETILLEADGLPAKSKCNAADYDAARKALDEFEIARKNVLEKDKALETYYVGDIENKYASLKNEYTRIKDLLNTYKASGAEENGANQEHNDMVADLQAKLAVAEKEMKDYYRDYYFDMTDKKVKLSIALAEAKDDLKAKRSAYTAAFEKVMLPLREDAESKADVLAMSKYVSYEYFDPFGIVGSKNDKEAFQLNKKYIKITVDVPQNEKLAKELLTGIKTHIRDYAEKRIESVTGSIKGNCTITNPTASVECISSGLIANVVKNAAVFAIAGVALTYFVLVVRMVARVNADSGVAVEGHADKKNAKDSEE